MQTHYGPFYCAWQNQKAIYIIAGNEMKDKTRGILVNFIFRPAPTTISHKNGFFCFHPETRQNLALKKSPIKMFALTFAHHHFQSEEAISHG